MASVVPHMLTKQLYLHFIFYFSWKKNCSLFLFGTQVDYIFQAPLQLERAMHMHFSHWDVGGSNAWHTVISHKTSYMRSFMHFSHLPQRELKWPRGRQSHRSLYTLVTTTRIAAKTKNITLRWLCKLWCTKRDIFDIILIAVNLLSLI